MTDKRDRVVHARELARGKTGSRRRRNGVDDILDVKPQLRTHPVGLADISAAKPAP